MPNKILIIGQAPPEQKQKLPYDTTMLYNWFEEVGIKKSDAKDTFEFDAVYDKFPGKDASGNHIQPSLKEMNEYFNRSLKQKISNHDKIIVLGKVAYNFLVSINALENKKFIELMHPSFRNIGKYKQEKKQLIEKLKEFIQ